MDNGVYIVLSRQTALFREMAVKAGNLSNSTTTGYTADSVLYRPFSLDDGNRNRMAFTQDYDTWRDTREGSIKYTGNPLDLAIGGKGYFTVETPLGNRYTRAGNFQLDGNGTLVTPEGYPVLDGDGQRIVFEDDDDQITISDNGTISANGQERGQIGIVQFENEQLLERLAGTMFRADVEPVPLDPENIRVQQGALEGSNVQAVTELVDMMQVSRAVGSTAKFIETSYELQRKASNTWAKQGG